MLQELQFVTYRIGVQQFAIEIHRLTEVLSYGPITPLPGAPSFVEGMIDLRGELVPVIDLRKRMGVKEIQNQMQTRILITRIQQQKIGFIVDLADQVYTIPVENIKAPPEGSEFILAVAKQNQDLLVILDLERLLTEQEQVRLRAFQVK
jgi:purine-binding chemotaxis protein CheW